MEVFSNYSETSFALRGNDEAEIRSAQSASRSAWGAASDPSRPPLPCTVLVLVSITRPLLWVTPRLTAVLTCGLDCREGGIVNDFMRERRVPRYDKPVLAHSLIRDFLFYAALVIYGVIAGGLVVWFFKGTLKKWFGW